MQQLLLEITGWLGYLQRFEVRLQVVALLLVFVGQKALGRWLTPRFPLLRRQGLVIPLLLLALSLLLGLGGVPFGLLLLGLLLYLGWLGLGVVHLLLGHFTEPEQLRLVETRLVRPAYLVLSTLLVIRVFDTPQDLALISIGEWFGSEVSLGNLMLAILVVYLLAMGTGPPSEGLAWLAQRGLGISNGSRRALALMIRYAVVAAGIVWALDHVGFNRTAILAVAGGLSVGLGFGVKEVFSNFVSGLWLLFEGSVRPGEVLLIEGDPCEVRSLGLRAAVLWRDRDNAELVIPNQAFFTTTTVTYTGSDTLRRTQVLVGVAYRHDPADVITLLEALARSQPRILASPPPKGLLLRYGDSSIEYGLRFWIANPMDNVSICSEMQMSIWTAFRDRGIEIPFPQQVQYQLKGTP